MSRKYLGLAVLCVVFIILGTIQVNAHDWYPIGCCGTVHCHPIDSCSEIIEQAKGYLRWNNHIFSPDQIHPSQDNQCHVCINNYNQSVCIFTQQNS